MNILKKYNYIYKFILFIITLTIIETIINLIIPLNKEINQIISLIGIGIYTVLSGIKKGLNSEEKAYKQGIKTGIIYVITMYILSIITFTYELTIKKIIYYLIIIGLTTLGSIIGINKKRH